ncbi:hypothetical protein SteCoe_18744 [Stentor coeruleus]|uniref:Uncharacterized protein n=1 Tax=Stentor coeruleus TaxID=5963 RepID=A0A1R2BW17_9CILI|nr:hypothetical protein SteCoe_18744 [Stentor coeruleus]
MEYGVKATQAYIHISFSVLWFLYATWWGVSIWLIHSSLTKSLHKLIFVVLIFKAFYIGLFGLSLLYTKSEEDIVYWGIATTSTFTLHNTFTYTTFSLISRGFCILRDSLNRLESGSVALVMGVVYLSFSTYLIAQDSLAPMILIIIGLLFYSSSSCSIKNIKSLQNRFYNLQEANIRRILPDISCKIYKMKVFLLFSYIFYTCEIVKIALLCIEKTAYLTNQNFIITKCSVELAVSTMSCFMIFFCLRPKEVLQGISDSIVIGNNPIAPILCARIPYSNVVVINKAAVVLTPQDLGSGSQVALLVAIPIK